MLLKLIITVVITAMISIMTINVPIDNSQDSEQLRLQDMLMMFLIPHVYEDVGAIYYPYILNMKPLIEGWKIDVINTERVNGFRGFIFEITLEVEPTIGHHVPVGKDRLIYQISYGPDVKLISHKHLETYKLPDDLKQFQAKGDINDKVIIQYYRLNHFY